MSAFGRWFGWARGKVGLRAVLASVAVGSAMLAASCAGKSPYERGEFKDSPRLRASGLPLAPGTPFTVRQGAFGKSSHREKGNEFSWDLEVPFGTPVHAVDDGVVMFVYQPAGGAGCDPQFADAAWNVQVEHKDRTVAQYVHVEAEISLGGRVRKGQRIGKTVERGWLCYPHLHFGIYRSRDTLHVSPKRETLPLRFDGVADGLLVEGQAYIAP